VCQIYEWRMKQFLSDIWALYWRLWWKRPNTGHIWPGHPLYKRNGKVKTLGCFHSYRDSWDIRDKRSDNSVIIYSLISYYTHMNVFQEEKFIAECQRCSFIQYIESERWLQLWIMNHISVISHMASEDLEHSAHVKWFNIIILNIVNDAFAGNWNKLKL